MLIELCPHSDKLVVVFQQVSILGALPFMMDIDDLPRLCCVFESFQFSDDTKLLFQKRSWMGSGLAKFEFK